MDIYGPYLFVKPRMVPLQLWVIMADGAFATGTWRRATFATCLNWWQLFAWPKCKPQRSHFKTRCYMFSSVGIFTSFSWKEIIQTNIDSTLTRSWKVAQFLTEIWQKLQQCEPSQGHGCVDPGAPFQPNQRASGVQLWNIKWLRNKFYSLGYFEYLWVQVFSKKKDTWHTCDICFSRRFIDCPPVWLKLLLRHNPQAAESPNNFLSSRSNRNHLWGQTACAVESLPICHLVFI